MQMIDTSERTRIGSGGHFYSKFPVAVTRAKKISGKNRHSKKPSVRPVFKSVVGPALFPNKQNSFNDILKLRVKLHLHSADKHMTINARLTY